MAANPTTEPEHKVNHVVNRDTKRDTGSHYRTNIHHHAQPTHRAKADRHGKDAAQEHQETVAPVSQQHDHGYNNEDHIGAKSIR